MRRGFICLLGMTPTLAWAAADAPIRWSPDGRWVAYTATEAAEGRLPAPGWIFERPGVRRSGGGRPDDDGSRPGGRYRIVACDAATDDSVLLEESPCPLSSPQWSPDGGSLAFGRVKLDGDGAGRFEVVVQQGLSQKRVLLSRPLGAPTPGLDWLPSQAPAWSPDGRYLAVVHPASTPGLSVVRADNGRVLKEVEGALWPAWSPDGTRLAFVRPGPSAALLVLDANFGPPRRVADLFQTFQTPSWSRDGRSVVALSRRVGGRGSATTQQVDLLRVQVDPGQADRLVQLSTDVIDGKAFRGVSFSADVDAEEVFSATDVAGQPSLVVWTRPRGPETINRFPPLDFDVRVGALALSPGSKTLAMRLGSPEVGPTVAFWEVGSGRLTLRASDDPARLEWLALLVANARELLAHRLPRPEGRTEPVRPTVLPVPGEIANQEVVYRLRKYGRLGRPLCDRPAVGSDADPALEPFLAEARLFFDVLREDYPAALASLEALEARTTEPDRLLRLLAVRAQIFLGLRDADRARDTIDYLRALEDRETSRIEVTPSGVAVRPEPSPTGGWARYLARQLANLTKAKPPVPPQNDGAFGEQGVRPPPPPLPPGRGLPFGGQDAFNPPRPPFAPVRGPGGPAPEIRARFRRPRRFAPGGSPPANAPRMVPPR